VTSVKPRRQPRLFWQLQEGSHEDFDSDLSRGKFQGGATAKTPPSAAKLPSIPAHAGPGVEWPFAEQNNPQMAHSLLRCIARLLQVIDCQDSQHPDSNREPTDYKSGLEVDQIFSTPRACEEIQF
jgi:hypothetical protein